MLGCLSVTSHFQENRGSHEVAGQEDTWLAEGVRDVTGGRRWESGEGGAQNWARG